MDQDLEIFPKRTIRSAIEKFLNERFFERNLSPGLYMSMLGLSSIAFSKRQTVNYFNYFISFIILCISCTILAINYFKNEALIKRKKKILLSYSLIILGALALAAQDEVCKHFFSISLMKVQFACILYLVVLVYYRFFTIRDTNHNFSPF